MAYGRVYVNLKTDDGETLVHICQLVDNEKVTMNELVLDMKNFSTFQREIVHWQEKIYTLVSTPATKKIPVLVKEQNTGQKKH